MFAAWRVAVVLSARNMTGPAFASFIAGASGAESSATRLQHAIGQVRSVATVGFAAAGVALSAFVAHGMDEAGKFELAMRTVSIATGATGSALKRLQSEAMTISGNTSQDVTQIASEMAMAAKSGLTQGQVIKLMPEIAAYADVQMRSHGTDPVEAVHQAVSEMHLLRAYSQHDMGAMLESLNKISFAQPEEMNRIVTQSGYFAPQARALGISPAEILDLIATMGQTGYLRGKGGTGVANMLAGVIGTADLTATRAKARNEARRGLGLIDASGKPVYVDREGKLDEKLFQEMIKHLEQVSEHTKPTTYYAMLQAAFGVGGGRFAQVITSKVAQDQMDVTRAKMAKIPTIAESQEIYLSTFLVSLNTLRTNITTALAVTFLPLIQRLTPWIRGLAAQVQAYAQWIFAHPDMGLKIAIGLITAAAASFGIAAGLAATQVWSLIASLRVLASAAKASAAANVANDAMSLIPGGRGARAAERAAFSVAEDAGALGRRAVVGPAAERYAAIAAERSSAAAAAASVPKAARVIGGVIDGAMALMMGRAAVTGVTRSFATGFAADLLTGLRGALGIVGRGIAGSFGFLGRLVTSLSPELMVFGRGIGFIGPVIRMVVPWLARLGLGFIPFVGEITLAITAIQLMVTHISSISWVAGWIYGLIVYKVLPAVGQGIAALASALWQGITGLFNALISGIGSFLSNPLGSIKSGGTGIGNFFDTMVRNFKMGADANNPNAKLVAIGAGGPTGLTMPGPRASLVGPSNAAASNVHNGDLVVNITGAQKSPKQIAKEVAAEHAKQMGFNSRSQGSGTISSPYAFSQGAFQP